MNEKRLARLHGKFEQVINGFDFEQAHKIMSFMDWLYCQPDSRGNESTCQRLVYEASCSRWL